MTKTLQAPPGYAALLKDIKERVRTAQVRAALAVNREFIVLYWSIGRDILDRQKVEGWGTKVIERLAKDLGTEFPGIEGFSPRNLKYMRAFAEAWPDKKFVQQAIAQLPWGHQTRLLDRIKDRPTREWYLNAAVEHGWSQNVLVHQISSRLHERQGKALTNFSQALPPEGSDLAEQILKDPYNFDFLPLTDSAKVGGCTYDPVLDDADSIELKTVSDCLVVCQLKGSAAKKPVAPRKAPARNLTSSSHPSVTAAPCFDHSAPLSESRTMTLTFSPLLSNSLATTPPTLPVTLATTNMLALLF